MLVILRRNWFTKQGRFKSNGKQPVEIPDSFIDALPRDAKVVNESKRMGRKPGRPPGPPKQ